MLRQKEKWSGSVAPKSSPVIDSLYKSIRMNHTKKSLVLKSGSQI